MYWLWRLPGKMLCDEEMEKHVCQKIWDSVKEHLWHRQVPTLLGEESRWNPANIPRLDPKANYSARNHATYDRFRHVKHGSCKEALAIARYTHQQALAAAVLLGEKIERFSCSLSHSHWCSGSHWCSSSCQWGSWTVGCQTKVLQVTSCHGDPAWRWPKSPSPSQSK